METLFLSSRKSTIKFVEEINSVKTAMLFSDTIALSPKDISWIFTKVSYSADSMSIQQKIKFLEKVFKDDTAFLESLVQTRKNIQRYQQTKNKTPQLIESHNKMMRTTNSFYQQTIDATIEYSLLKDVTSFLPFFEQDFVKCIDLPDDEVTIEHDEFYFNKQSDILLRKFNNKVLPPFVFVLPTSYRQYEKSSCLINDNDVADKTKGWFDAAINITGFNKLSLSELLTMREDLTDIRIRFNDAMNIWIEKSEQDSWNFDDISYYEQKVSSIINELNLALIQHPILMPYYKNSEQHFLRIGAIPVGDIWHYYHQLNFIDDNDLELLKPFQNELAYKGRWPVFAPVFINQQSEELKNESSDAETIKRKFINLD
jgi:hypothetical protein